MTTTMIQYLADAASERDAAQLLAYLKTQDGCLGGRVLAPKFELHGWVAQVFHVAPADARVGMPMPDGMRVVIVPNTLRAALGILPVLAPLSKEQVDALNAGGYEGMIG